MVWLSDVHKCVSCSIWLYEMGTLKLPGCKRHFGMQIFEKTLKNVPRPTTCLSDILTRALHFPEVLWHNKLTDKIYSKLKLLEQ